MELNPAGVAIAVFTSSQALEMVDNDAVVARPVVHPRLPSCHIVGLRLIILIVLRTKGKGGGLDR